MHMEFSNGESSVVIPATVNLAIIKVIFIIVQSNAYLWEQKQTHKPIGFCYNHAVSKGFQVLPRNLLSLRDRNSEALESVWFNQDLI